MGTIGISTIIISLYKIRTKPLYLLTRVGCIKDKTCLKIILSFVKISIFSVKNLNES